MMPIDICPICLQRRRLSKHHIWKLHVWRNNGCSDTDIEYICESCHQVLEAEITRKENEILQQYPEIYAGTFNDFLAIGKKEIDAKRKKLPFVKRRKRRRK